MDVIRRPYTTLCQFNDGGPPARIRWYIVPRGTPALGVPSVISSLDWLTEPWTVGPIGERPGQPRPYDRRPAPDVAGLDHVCGTPHDFEFGGVYDPAAPPVLYGPDGLPACCRPLPDALMLGGGAQLLDEGAILLSGENQPEPPSYCAAYQVNPPAGVTMVHPPPGLDPYLWSQPGAGLPRAQLEAPEYPGGDPDTWYFRVLGTGFVAVTTAWDGTGVRAFDVQTPPGSTINIGCAD